MNEFSKQVIDFFKSLQNKLSLLFYPMVAAFTFLINYHLVAKELLATDAAPDAASQWLSLGGLFYISALIGLAIQLSKYISFRDLMKLGIGYLVYISASYFLVMTKNINHPKFKWDAWEKNGLLETGFLSTLIWILILAFAFKYLFRLVGIHRRSQRYLPEHESNHFILASLIGSFAVNDSKFLSYLGGNLQRFLTDQHLGAYLTLLALAVFMSSLAFIFLANASLNGLRDLKYNQSSINLVLASSALFALIFNYTLQLGVQEKVALLGYYLFPGATMFQITVIFCLVLLAYTVINQYFSASIVIIGLGTVISIANSIKMSMRNEPLLLTDFVWVKELHLVISFVDKHLFNYLILILVGVIVLAIVLRKKLVSGKIYSHWTKQVWVIAALGLLFLANFRALSQAKDYQIQQGVPVLSKLHNLIRVDYMGFAINARYKSVMYIWAKQLTNPIMDKPESYSPQAIKDLAVKYEALAEEINATRKENISDQTVIYVLSESLADPSRVPGVTLSMDVLPQIKAIQAQTTSGLMKSDGYGGGTANMEFQTLTGLPFYHFSPSVSTLYSEVVPKMSVFPSISHAFDASQRYVLHPSGAGNYNRLNIYRKLDFKDLVFLDGSKDSFQNISRQGVSVSDETVYQNILDRLDDQTGQFFSVITMQNHAPWSVGNPVEVTASGEGFTEKQNSDLTEYARLLTHTDTATKNFLEALKRVDQKVTVVFYGDHLPGFYPESTFTSQPESQYQTDYFIWSNWETESLDYPLLNSSDFTAALLAHTNSKVSPYYALLTKVLEEASVGTSIETPEQQAIIEDLKLIQYDITVGKGYIKSNEDFFTLPPTQK